MNKKPLFSFISICLLSAVSLFAQQKYALVIGNKNYIYQWGPLNNPINDATDVSEALKSLGCSVVYIADGNRNRIFTELTNLKNKLSASPNSYGIFYFAGHGHGEYLIPVDAEYDKNMLDHQALPVSYILKVLEDASNVFNLILLDACRDTKLNGRGGGRGLLPVTHQPSGSIVVYSTKPGETAEDGTGRNSPFTSQLLKHIRTPGIDVLTMLNRTSADVVSTTKNRQVPHLSILYYGTAYLGSKPNNNVPVPPPPPPPPPIRSLHDQLVNATGTITITVTQDTELPTETVISRVSSITLRGDTARRTVLGNGSNDITIQRGVTLTLENITLRGVRVIVNEGGTLVMNNASTIAWNNLNGVLVRGTFTMNGGSIINNGGGGVSIFDNGRFTMNGGRITNNEAFLFGGGGGGVYVEGGTFTMQDGRIENNTSAFFGGGVSVRGTFYMHDGIIAGNKALYGGGVYIDSNGTFRMTGGTIYGSNGGSNANVGGIGNALYNKNKSIGRDMTIRRY